MNNFFKSRIGYKDRRPVGRDCLCFQSCRFVFEKREGKESALVTMASDIGCDKR